MIDTFTKEELKTYIGCLMLDLRGSWGWDVEERVEELRDCFSLLTSFEEDERALNEIYGMIDFCNEELEESIPNGDFDGRIFRGEYLYGYSSPEGKTQKVKELLEVTLNYPEHHSDWDAEN